MPRIKASLLAFTILAASPLFAAGGIAFAQRAPVYDPAQLPEIKGQVAQYTLTPRGDVDGLILTDGTEVHLPPFMSTQVVMVVKPGDAVTIHGLKARAVAMVAAASITNDASGTTVTVSRAHGPRGGNPLEVSGKVKEQLHTPRGELNGVLLADGSIVRLPPPEAKKLGDQLAVGASITAKGDGYAGPLGRVVAAREIGPDAAHLTTVAFPHPEHRGMRDRMHGPEGMRGHGPMGDRPMAPRP